MVSPVKFLTRAIGLPAPGDSVTPAAPAPDIATPQAPPLVGAQPAPQRGPERSRQFAPTIISGAGAEGRGKTLIGQ